MVTDLLRELGHAVVEATNGVEAVALCLREAPDLLILDLLMPKLSGLDALHALRAKGVARPRHRPDRDQRPELPGARRRGRGGGPAREAGDAPEPRAGARQRRPGVREAVRFFRSLLGLVLLASMAPAALVAAVVARAHGGVDAATLAGLAAALALAGVLSALVARSVTRPLRAVVGGALEIARGRFGREVPLTGARNELGDLAYTFNHMSRELAGYDAENRRLIEALERGYLDTIRSLAAAVDAKDPYTRGHAERVAALSVEIGRELGLAPDALQALQFGGILHDIGKIGIPDAILAKVGALGPEEMALVRDHPRIGAEIVSGVEFLAGAAEGIRSHHERWDGTGYPDRLAGDAIPLVARIVNIADTWDACTSRRPYQDAIPPDQAIAILDGLKGTQTDPGVHDALLRTLRRRAGPRPER